MCGEYLIVANGYVMDLGRRAVVIIGCVCRLGVLCIGCRVVHLAWLCCG